MSATTSGSKPSKGWQPPSLEEMQGMLPQYRFEKLLGRGGMGAVYKAVQASLERPVAIKVLPVDLVEDDDAQFAERFKNEARTMAKLSHPGIVDVFDFGETKTGLLYIVMEFIEGTDIAQMIQSQGKLPEDYALSITAHVCDALAYAHQNGIVHRDIKPANILINMEGAIKVADFGLAKANDPGQSGITKTNMAMGTPDFVAPEAFIPGVPLDGRADLYAIGVMLYQMLTGEIPRGLWTLPGMKLGTDPRFDAIITKAMQTDREVRYQTAAEIRQELDVIMTTPRAVLIQQQQAAAEAAARATQAQKQAVVADKSQPQRRMPQQQDHHHAPPPEPKKSGMGMMIGLLGSLAIVAVGAFIAFKKPTPPARVDAASTDEAAWVDMIPLLKSPLTVTGLPNRDSDGEWSLASGAVSVKGAGPHVAVSLPVDMPASYDLTLKMITEGLGISHMGVLFPVAGRMIKVNTIQRYDGSRDGITTIVKVAKGTPNPKYFNIKPSFLQANEERLVEIAVRAGGDQASLSVKADGQSVFEWSGPQDKLMDDGEHSPNSPRGKVALTASMSANATWREVRYRPVTGAAAVPIAATPLAASTVPEPTMPVNPPAPIASLPATGWQSLPSDAVQADGSGKLTKSTFVPGYPPDIALRARLRFAPNSAGISAQSTNAVGSYRAEITPKGDAVMLHRDSPVAAERKALARAALSAPLTPGQEYVLAVASVGDTVSVHVDGRPLLSERLPKLPGSVVLWTRSPVDVRDIEWLAFPGSSTSSPPVPTPAVAPAMTSPVAATPAVPLDPAQRFSGLSLPKDLTKKGGRSSWEFSGEQLVLSDTTFQDLQLLALPLKPGDSYEMEVEYAFHTDQLGYLKLFLPAPQGWCSLQLHPGQIVCFFDNNRQPHPHSPKPGGETNRLRVKSERSGTAARFTVTLNDKPVTEFTGNGVTEWRFWSDMSPLRGSICLGGETKGGPPITLHSFRLVSNEGTPSTMAAAPTPAVKTSESPAPAPPTGWIDLLARADVQRDSLQLPWSLTDGVLQSPAEPNSATTPNGHNSFVFPVPDPPLNYDLRYRLSRNKPGAAIVMPFRRGSETPVLYVDGGYGFQLFGATTAGPKNSGPAWFPPEKIIREVLIEVRESHLNVRYDGRLLVESDGALPMGQVQQPFFQSAKYKEPIIGIGVCGGLITVHEAAYRPVDVLAEKTALMSATDSYLAKLESGFQARYQTDAQKPFETAMASLNQSYITNGINKARAAAQAKGVLPEVLQFDQEKALIEKDSDVPAEDAADTPDSLKKLRATYRTARAKLVTERDAKAAPLMNIYLKALDDYAAELTKSGKVDEAKQVQTLRDMKAAAGPAAQAVISTAAVSKDGLVNSLGMKFILVKGTNVLFCIHETRRQDYAAFAAENPGVSEDWKNAGQNGVPCGDKDDHSVVGVRWLETQGFCAWLSKKEGKTYRLPTDEEWSVAAGLGRYEKRTKDTTPQMLSDQQRTEYPWGGDYPPKTSDQAGNFSDMASRAKFPDLGFIEGYNDGFPTTAPVMSFKPNKAGLYDMGGNALEWVEDWLNVAQTNRVLRGGSFMETGTNLLSSHRYFDAPDLTRHFTGFRVVIEISKKAP